MLERESIDTFRESARYLAHPGEAQALGDDLTALAVLRHYGVRNRLLDWSLSPHIAVYFAACDHDSVDGELWAFDEPVYEVKGKEQWIRWPETTRAHTGNPEDFEAGITAFARDEPPDWFICMFYGPGFPRQNVQQGAYSLTARFDRDHADAISSLMNDDSYFHRYVIASPLKITLRNMLRERHGIWRGSLFPDVAGAAATAALVFDR